MKVYLLIIFLLVACKLIYGQHTQQNKVSVYVKSGLIQQTTNDRLLNYYNYSGNAMAFSLYGSYVRNKNLLTLNLLHQTTKLYPINLINNYYAYNYIQHRDTELKLEYFREMTKLNNYIVAYIGVENISHITLQKETYKSLLFNNAEEIRKSYDVSAISLSPMLLVNFRLKKNNLILKTGCSLLHYAARPDDNFVKQTGLENKIHWNLFWPKEYKSILFSATYQYEISNAFGVMAEYNILYRTYSSFNDYKYLRYSYLLGVGKTF